MNNTFSTDTSLSLLLLNHQHIHENIKFADQKAMVFIAISTGLLGAIYPLINPKDATTLYAGFVICSILTLGIGFGIGVIIPRPSSNGGRRAGVVDPNSIHHFSLADFVARVGVIPDSELLDEVRIFIHDRSYVHHMKYLYLRLSILVSSVGWFGSILLAGWSKLGA